MKQEINFYANDFINEVLTKNDVEYWKYYTKQWTALVRANSERIKRNEYNAHANSNLLFKLSDDIKDKFSLTKGEGIVWDMFIRNHIKDTELEAKQRKQLVTAVDTITNANFRVNKYEEENEEYEWHVETLMRAINMSEMDGIKYPWVDVIKKCASDLADMSEDLFVVTQKLWNEEFAHLYDNDTVTVD